MRPVSHRVRHWLRLLDLLRCSPSNAAPPRLPQSEIKAEKLDGIVARQAIALLFRQTTEVILDDLPRMGERHVEVRIVVGPHAVLLTPPREKARAHVILEECAVHMLVEDFAWLALDRQLAIAPEAVEVVVPLLQHERQ